MARKITTLIVLVVSFTIIFGQNFFREIEKKPYHYVFPSPTIKRFSFGFNEIMADVHWVRMLQDANTCVYPKAPPDAPRTGPNRTPHCELDWVYHMLEVITELAPRFHFAYSFGGTLLSVVLDDVKGATRIVEKGVSRFPNDWRIHYQAAIHLLVEEGDKFRSAYLFDKAVSLGAPSWMASLSAKLYSEAGRTELAVFNLKRFIKMYPYDKFIKDAKLRLEELEKTLTREQIEKIDALIEHQSPRSPKRTF